VMLPEDVVGRAEEIPGEEVRYPSSIAMIEDVAGSRFKV
jgi:hypothetical protein